MRKIISTMIALFMLSAIGANAQQRSKVRYTDCDGTPSAIEVYTTAERNAEHPSEDKTIFNRSTQSIEKWDGTRWSTVSYVSPPDNAELLPTPDPSTVDEENSDGTKITCIPPALAFAKYNLGADVETLDKLSEDLGVNAAKAQMHYLAEYQTTMGKGDTAYYVKATVNGGLYQWGRKDTEYAVKKVGNMYIRWGHFGADSGDNEEKQNIGRENNVAQGPVGSISAAVAGTFYTGVWYSGSDAGDLWGGGVNHKQNPVKTEYDPCPEGFRVPTEDDWEQLLKYDCNAGTYYNGTKTQLQFDNGASVVETPRGLVWVRVYCAASGDKCIPTSNKDVSGFAIYTKEEWNKAHSDYKTGNTSLHKEEAPNPILFLPAGGERLSEQWENGKYKAGNTIGTWTNACYWSSTIHTNDVSYLNVFRDSGIDKVQIHTATDKYSRGMSIRCVAE
ncbi:MAG: hypothetical protein LBS54_01370 [Dysgonamonadaceae bacterium]|jgi:hypothetical protein|nr:hypothetical protein [Dysgonamonadaceae bacterium]